MYQPASNQSNFINRSQAPQSLPNNVEYASKPI